MKQRSAWRVLLLALGCACHGAPGPRLLPAFSRAQSAVTVDIDLYGEVAAAGATGATGAQGASGASVALNGLNLSCSGQELELVNSGLGVDAKCGGQPGQLEVRGSTDGTVGGPQATIFTINEKSLIIESGASTTPALVVENSSPNGIALRIVGAAEFTSSSMHMPMHWRVQTCGDEAGEASANCRNGAGAACGVGTCTDAVAFCAAGETLLTGHCAAGAATYVYAACPAVAGAPATCSASPTAFWCRADAAGTVTAYALCLATLP